MLIQFTHVCTDANCDMRVDAGTLLDVVIYALNGCFSWTYEGGYGTPSYPQYVQCVGSTAVSLYVPCDSPMECLCNPLLSQSSWDGSKVPNAPS